MVLLPRRAGVGVGWCSRARRWSLDDLAQVGNASRQAIRYVGWTRGWQRRRYVRARGSLHCNHCPGPPAQAAHVCSSFQAATTFRRSKKFGSLREDSILPATGEPGTLISKCTCFQTPSQPFLEGRDHLRVRFLGLLRTLRARRKARSVRRRGKKRPNTSPTYHMNRPRRGPSSAHRSGVARRKESSMMIIHTGCPSQILRGGSLVYMCALSWTGCTWRFQTDKSNRLPSSPSVA